MSDTEKQLVECMPRLLQYARLLTKNSRISPEDLVSDTVLRILERVRAGAYKEEGAFMSYAATAMRNTFLNQIKRERRIAADPELPLLFAVDPGDLEQQTIDRDLLKRVTDAIPESRIELFAMIASGAQYDDCARHFAVPIGTVRSRLARVRDRLREVVEC